MGVLKWYLHHPAGDLATWWDKNKKDSEEALNFFVDAHPHWWALAAGVQTCMDVGQGFVDVLRFGEGISEYHATGKVAPLIQDAFRGLTVASGAAKVLGTAGIAGRAGAAMGRAVGLYEDVAPARGICAAIAVGNAVRRVGQRLLLSLDEIAAAHGWSGGILSAEGATMEESISALKALKVDHAVISRAGSWENVVSLLKQRRGVMMIRVVGTKSVGAHRVVVEAAEDGVRIIDRSGIYNSLEELSAHYALNGGKWVVDPEKMAVLVKAVTVRIINGLPTLMAYVNALLPHLRGDMSVSQLDAAFQQFKAQNAAGPPAAAGTVTVAQGDTLSGLAEKHYGSANLWPLLWDANKSLVGQNPNLLSRGMVLVIPPLLSFTTAQLADARRRHPAWQSFPLAAGR
jgi:hypothetical protein